MPNKKRVRSPRRGDFEKRVGDFGEEVGRLGEGFGRSVDCAGSGFNRWYDSAFSIAGPLISALVGMVCLVLAVLLLEQMRAWTGFSAPGRVAVFLKNSLLVLFAAGVFFSYARYAERRAPRQYWLFSPVVSAAGIVFAFWIAAEIMLALNPWLKVPAVSSMALFFKGNIALVFLFFAVLGYFALSLERKAWPAEKKGGSKMAKEGKQPKAKRLYRSADEKILGGVCGGIAEYLNVDPVVVRLLWVLASLLWGFGVLLYIICWIIIPRNPNQKWRG